MNLIEIRTMQADDAGLIRQIDRSETIEKVYVMKDGELEELTAGHECPTWNEEQVKAMIERYRQEIEAGGTAFGAFDGDTLAGFAVLGHRFRGKELDQLQVDLMYVSRAFRRQGIGKRLMDELCAAAREQGARALYISSTETESAVRFYQSNGSMIAEEVDEELFSMEPEDIHMILKL